MGDFFCFLRALLNRKKRKKTGERGKMRPILSFGILWQLSSWKNFNEVIVLFKQFLDNFCP